MDSPQSSGPCNSPACALPGELAVTRESRHIVIDRKASRLVRGFLADGVPLPDTMPLMVPPPSNRDAPNLPLALQG